MQKVEVAGEELKSYALDHHGIIAAVCKDLGIAKRIDDRLNKRSSTMLSALG